MIAALAVGSQVHTARGHVVILAVTVIGVCFTWPSLEALASEREEPARLPRVVGIYNVVWAATAAAGYFIGGAMLEWLGWRSLFFVPIAILLIEFGLLLWFESQAREAAPPIAAKPLPSKPHPQAHPVGRTKVFLRLAWLANPFAYIAINTFIALMPGIAKRLELSTMAAGFCCSCWSFTRLAAFFVLWRYTGGITGSAGCWLPTWRWSAALRPP